MVTEPTLSDRILDAEAEGRISHEAAILAVWYALGGPGRQSGWLLNQGLRHGAGDVDRWRSELRGAGLPTAPVEPGRRWGLAVAQRHWRAWFRRFAGAPAAGVGGGDSD